MQETSEEKEMTPTEALIRFILERLANHQNTFTEYDAGRIEELCFILQESLKRLKK